MTGGTTHATVRPARVEDAEAVGRVHVAAWRWAYAGLMDAAVLDGLDAGRRAAFWRDWLAAGSPGGTLLVAERDGVIVGFVNHGVSRDPDATPATGEIRALYVERAVQGTGVGAALMNRALAGLAAAGHREATLWVLATNALGRAFYDRGGWAPDGATQEDEHEGSAPLPEIRLRRPLP